MSEIAQLTQKYQTMTRAHSRGAQDGNRNLPPGNASRLSQTELEIVQLAQDEITRYSNRQVKKCRYDGKIALVACRTIKEHAAEH